MGIGFDAYTGHVAGLTTSVLWTITSLSFAAASRRLGPTFVNMARILLAVLLLGLTYRYRFGLWVPDAQAGQVVLLALSGLVGLSIGDQALLVALVDIGPRLTTLLMTTSPLFAAFFGWMSLGESLHGLAWVGIILTVGGVGWVVLERPAVKTAGEVGSHRLRGLLCALLASACQACGLLLSKQGMGHGWLPEDQRLDPQAATLIRMVFAGVGVLPIVAIHARRECKRRLAGILPERERLLRSGLILTGVGSVAGPYLGVWMSLVASDRAPLGIAQTLCSLSPLLILPMMVLIHKERVSSRAILGAAAAVSGSALLFVKPG